LAAVIERVTGTYCSGRVAYVLEGGYDPQVLAQSVAAIIVTHDAHRVTEPAADRSAIPAAQQAILERIGDVLRA
jgi:acetoin utilization deacetylase AcuC-like enzyme